MLTLVNQNPAINAWYELCCAAVRIRTRKSALRLERTAFVAIERRRRAAATTGTPPPVPRRGFLTAAGIYALMVQSVAARLREFGVRAALGATPRALIRMIVRESLLLTLPGLIVGTILALSFARLMKTFVYHVPAADPISITVAALCLVAVAAISGWLPARRAAAIDTAAALKAE